jgi:tetratricopeptide (TPR) repeat protein
MPPAQCIRELAILRISACIRDLVRGPAVADGPGADRASACPAPARTAGSGSHAVRGKILVAHPESAEAHYRHANVLKDRRELEAAVAGYDRAIALRPDYAHAFCNRAVVLGQMQKLPEALASYDRAIALVVAAADGYIGLTEWALISPVTGSFRR